MNLTLTRDYFGTDCTLGQLVVNGDRFQTMERPWVPEPHAPCGKKGISSVPPGTYRLMRHNSEAHPRTWALTNPNLWVYHFDEDVPVHQHDLARTLVLIHPANFASELLGCIAPGLERKLDGDRWMVTASRLAMARIQAQLPWVSDHFLDIT